MPVSMHNLNASWKESKNVMVFDWHQKDFSRQMRMAAGCLEEGRMMRVGGIPRRNQTDQQKQ